MKAATSDNPPGHALPHARAAHHQRSARTAALSSGLMLVALLMGSVYILPMAMDSLLGFPLLYIVMRDSSMLRNCAELWRDPLAKCASLLLLYGGLTLFWSPQWQATDLVQVSLRMLLCACFVCVLASGNIEATPFTRTLCRLIAVCALVSAVICIGLWLYAPADDGRLSGLFRLNNAGKAGRMYAAAMPILVLGLALDSGRWRILLAGAFAASLAALVCTDTRAAWLGGLVGVIYLLLAGWQPRLRPFLFLALGLGAAVLAALLAVVTHPSPEVTSALLPRGDSLRPGIWAAHLQHTLREFPIFGGGFHAELNLFLSNMHIRGAHSMYLSTALQGGVIGLSLFLATSAWTGLRLIQHLQLPLARLAFSLLLMGLVVYVFNGDRLIDKVNFTWFVTWLPLAIALSLRHPPAIAGADSPAG